MIPKEVDFEMREGDHPNPRMNNVEKMIAEEAYQRVVLNPAYQELGFKRTYNLMHLFRFYMSRDPYIVKLLYDLEPYPEYVEMEVVQGHCPLNCVFCEKTYWNEKPMFL